MFIKDTQALDRELTNIKTTVIGMLQHSKHGVDIDIKKHKQKRSNLQNSFYHVNCGDVALFLNNAGMEIEKAGFKCMWKSEDVHEVNKLRFNVATTTKLSVPEFVSYMDGMFAFWQEKTKYNWQPRESTRGYAERTGLI